MWRGYIKRSALKDLRRAAQQVSDLLKRIFPHFLFVMDIDCKRDSKESGTFLLGHLPPVSHLEFEAVDDVLDVGAGQRLSEAQLFGKVDLSVELVELLQKLLLRHGTVQDGAANTRPADKSCNHHKPLMAESIRNNSEVSAN